MQAKDSSPSIVMLSKSSEERRAEDIATKATARDSESHHHTGSRVSLTTIIEEQSGELSAIDSRKKMNQNGGDYPVFSLAKAFDDLDEKLKLSLHSLKNDLDLFWISRENTATSLSVKTSFKSFLDQQHTKACSEISSGLDRCEYYMTGLLGRPSGATIGPTNVDAWASEGRVLGDAKRGIEDRANFLRNTMVQELKHLREARLVRLSALFEGQLAQKSKTFFTEMRKQIRAGTSADEKTGFLLGLKQKNAENAEVVFRMRREVEDLQANIAKL